MPCIGERNSFLARKLARLDGVALCNERLWDGLVNIIKRVGKQCNKKGDMDPMDLAIVTSDGGSLEMDREGDINPVW